MRHSDGLRDRLTNQHYHPQTHAASMAKNMQMKTHTDNFLHRETCTSMYSTHPCGHTQLQKKQCSVSGSPAFLVKNACEHTSSPPTPPPQTQHTQQKLNTLSVLWHTLILCSFLFAPMCHSSSPSSILHQTDNSVPFPSEIHPYTSEWIEFPVTQKGAIGPAQSVCVKNDKYGMGFKTLFKGKLRLFNTDYGEYYSRSEKVV